jgi:hypothetical protein
MQVAHRNGYLFVCGASRPKRNAISGEPEPTRGTGEQRDERSAVVPGKIDGDPPWVSRNSSEGAEIQFYAMKRDWAKVEPKRIEDRCRGGINGNRDLRVGPSRTEQAECWTRQDKVADAFELDGKDSIHWNILGAG